MKRFDWLRDTPFFWSRLGFCYDPPRCDEEGRPIVFSRDYEKYRRFHREFLNAGIIHHTTILHSGWVDDGVYDYRLTDETLEAVLGGNPDLRYMPRIKLNAPPGWCRNHPEDVFVYERGQGLTPEEIAARCGTLQQDYFGFDSPGGYPVNGGDGTFRDDRPNVGGVIALQSFSSPAWLRDAGEALRRLIAHLEDTPYAHQIVGYHIAYGQCGETAPWGSWRRREEWARGDFGYTNTREFVNFGLRKYGSEAALLAAWGVPSLSEICVPSLMRREGRKSTLRELFFACPGDAILRDYHEFSSEVNSRAAISFCRIVKECTAGEAAAGVFFGYLYLPLSAYTGHCAPDAVLSSPYVDFLAAPKGYFRAGAGDPGGAQGPTYSYNRKKVWLDEIDNRTHLDRRTPRAKDAAESRTLLLREGVKNLSAGQGFWWMDLGDGWYDSPELMAVIRELDKAQARIAGQKHESVAEILLVVDEASVRNMAPSYGLAGGLLYNLQSELHLVGAPVDTLRMSDLPEIDLSRYKLIVFANAFFVDAKTRRLLRENARGKTYLWHYTPGILSPEFSVEGTRALTGFDIAEFEHSYQNEEVGYRMSQYGYPMFVPLELDFPLVEVLPSEEMRVRGRYPDGRVLCAETEKDGGRSILCTLASLSAEDMRSIAVEAGCRMPAPVNCTVYADNRIIGIFPKVDTEFLLDLGTYAVHGEHRPALKIPAGGAEYLIYDKAD